MKIKILCLCILAVAAGCRKDGSITEKDTHPLKMSGKIAKIELPFNIENPADSIGIIHNQALDYVYKKLYSNKDFSDDLKRKCLVDFFEKRYGEDLSKSVEERDQRFRMYDNVPVLKLSEKLQCSNALATSVNSILLAAYNLKSPLDYNSFKQKVIGLERKAIKGELKMSRTDTDQLLHFTSVIRHSMWFWMNAVAKCQNQNEAEFLRKIIRGIFGGLSDAHGALVSLFSYMSFRYVLEDASLDSAMALFAFDV